MDADHVAGDLESVLFSEAEIAARVTTLAQELGRDYAGRDPVLIGVLGGAATFTVDLARAFEDQLEITWMAIRSYTTRNRASGSVRLLKDLDLDIAGRDVIIVDGVIDTGLTMSWLITNLAQRGPASVESAVVVGEEQICVRLVTDHPVIEPPPVSYTHLTLPTILLV